MSGNTVREADVGVAKTPTAAVEEIPSPHNPYLASGHHDVPWEEPALMRELLHGPWPERQWPAQLYHFFRPPKPTVWPRASRIGNMTRSRKRS